MEGQTGVKPEQLESMIELPEWATDIWIKFCTVSAYRDDRGRILPSEVMAWSTLTGANLTPLEYNLIGVIDAAYLESKKDEQ